jgi:hypothetical protein
LGKNLAAQCFMLYLDIREHLDPLDVDYTDLFLLVSRQILEALRKEEVSLRPELLRDVENWFREVTKETEKKVELSGEVKAQAKAGFSFASFLGLLTEFLGHVKAGSAQKVTTRLKLDSSISQLLNYTNVLLTAASDALRKAGKPCQILVMFDNLDRVPREKSERLFFDHGSSLQALACHVIYTVPIETYYSRRRLESVFPRRDILPNVRLRAGKSSARPNQAGMDALREIVGRRIDVPTLMQPPTLGEHFIHLSGGSVRQLIRLLSEAVLSAQARSLAVIDREALEDAARNLRHDFVRMLTSSDYELLARTSTTNDIEKDLAHMELLSNLAIMEYNGEEVWYDVNPLIESIDAFQAVVRKSRPKRRRG